MTTTSSALSRRSLLLMGLGTAAGAATTLVIRPPAAHAGTSTQPDLVTDWFDLINGLSGAAAPPGSGVPDRIWAICWLAAATALQTARSAPSQEAATASAIHDCLATLVPDQKSTVDAALAASLDAIPDGAAKRAGIEAGQRAGAQILADREGDGLDLASLNRPFTPPPEAPGVYRLPPGATQTQGAGIRYARPFLLGRADRFRPGPTPALGTERYRRDLRELHRLGGADANRTERQSDIAWLAPDMQYVPALHAVLGQPGRTLAWKVRLLAAYATAKVDAQIAVSEAKFTYLHWRPVTAIRSADTDGDPRTRADLDWSSNLPTPPNPEYPSAHAVIAGAAERVLEHYVGAYTPVGFSATIARGDGRVATLEYRPGTPWSTLTRDNIDARVWAGVHFRSSDEVGAVLGRSVGEYDLGQLS